MEAPFSRDTIHGVPRTAGAALRLVPSETLAWSSCKISQHIISWSSSRLPRAVGIRCGMRLSVARNKLALHLSKGRGRTEKENHCDGEQACPIRNHRMHL